MNPTAFAIAVVYGAACVVALIAIIAIWRSTHRPEGEPPPTVDTEKLAHREKAWFAIVLAALGALLLATLPFIPYGDTAAAEGQQAVDVTALQFAWIISPGTVEAGTPVRFSVEADDVAHGFAVYNDDNVMLFQTQVTPGYTSHIVHTFDEPGLYQVVCLEFCGVGHHEMLGTITVEPSA